MPWPRAEGASCTHALAGWLAFPRSGLHEHEHLAERQVLTGAGTFCAGSAQHPAAHAERVRAPKLGHQNGPSLASMERLACQRCQISRRTA